MSHSRVEEARRLQVLDRDAARDSGSRLGFGGGRERSGRSAQIAARAGDPTHRRDGVVAIAMVGEYPFIEGSVAGVKGKLMLDTGAEQALAINDHRVPVANGRTIGTGHFGSGETFAVRLVPELTAIRIGPLRFARATTVQAQDARQLEGITPDFLGWLGHHAWAGSAMKLDYRASRVTFYKGGPGAYLKGGRVIAELPFETRKLPNHPLMPGRIGDTAIIAAWDTGQYGSLFTDAAGKAALLRSRHLTVSSDKEGAYDLAGLELTGRSQPIISSMEVETARSPAAAPIGISEPHSAEC